jgi:uncharacterized protein CbrC (UPF0167 family)
MISLGPALAGTDDTDCVRRRPDFNVRHIPMSVTEITDRDRAKAQGCVECPVCTRARRKQRGLAFWLVKHVEGSVCPYCQAYEKVYGRKSHEPVKSHDGAA